jgi:ABC-type amino acid transport substrate-binding protein
LKKILLLFIVFTLSSTESNALPEFPVKDTLVVGYNINPPFTFKQNGKLVGVSYRLWRKIIRSDNHTVYNYVQVPLDSLLLGLRKGSIDIAISPLTITSDRSKYIDFSVPYYLSSSGGMVKHHTNFKRIKEYAAAIFSFRFFNIILTLLLMISFFGFLTWLFERHHNPDFGHGIRGIWNGFWWSAVTMTTVGYGDKSPKTVGGRIIGLIWMFMGVILISSITASITSTLTIRKMEISSEDVMTYKDTHIGTVKNSATEQWLLDNYFHNVTSYHNFDQMLDALRKDQIEVIAYDEPVLRYIIKNDHKNEFEMVKMKYNPAMYSFGFNDHFGEQRREFINSQLLEITESNDWKRLLSEFNLSTN